MRALVIAVLASVGVYVVLIVVTDGPEVMKALSGFPLGTFALILALSVGCYVVRGLRWGALVRRLGYQIDVRDALYVHIAGQTMSVSPGRVGEVLKPWLTRELAGMPLTQGIALVFAERIADLIAVCILALGGVSLVRGGPFWLAAALALMAAGTFIVSSDPFHRLALRVVGRSEWMRRHHASATTLSETIRVSLGWRTLTWSVASSVLAWGLEGVGFALCLDALGFAALDLPSAVSIYAVSTIAGAFTFLPGGIGLTEASMAGILVAVGMGASDASAATLITRVATLWWAVLIGWGAIALRPAPFRRLVSSGGEPDARKGS
jgi:uncharacterized protein (TIRG00374 family)